LKKLFTIIVLTAALAVSATAAPKHAPKAQAVKITDGPRVEGTGPTWAVIAWTTNTGGSSVIRYGTDANHLTQTAKSAYADNDKTKAQNHRVHLKNLKPGTKYFFQVDSGQGEGTGTEAKSSVAEFTTKGHK
jgi:phosphodiesterase/alkaline phosphatase D-like protein